MSRALSLALALALGAVAGCDAAPGRPTPSERELPPWEISDFATLYAASCAGCHGTDGRLGAAQPLHDPVYLALAPAERMRAVIAGGVPGTPMPVFAQSRGGSLTDAQIDILVAGMREHWARPSEVPADGLPPYAAALGDSSRGAAVYQAACASCHGAEGRGGPKGGSVVDTAYLALTSNQGLRTVVIAGRSDLDMPDWRGSKGAPLSNQAVSDVVAWLAAHRGPVDGRPDSPQSARAGGS